MKTKLPFNMLVIINLIKNHEACCKGAGLVCAVSQYSMQWEWKKETANINQVSIKMCNAKFEIAY